MIWSARTNDDGRLTRGSYRPCLRLKLPRSQPASIVCLRQLTSGGWWSSFYERNNFHIRGEEQVVDLEEAFSGCRSISRSGTLKDRVDTSLIVGTGPTCHACLHLQPNRRDREFEGRRLFSERRRSVLSLRTKRGKEHEVPCHRLTTKSICATT
jgi:hypothetical protein